MIINGSKVKLRGKKLSDARDDYRWYTDPELTQLDAVPVMSIPFAHFLLDYASELRYSTPTSNRFAIDTLEGKHIGNCTFYDISKARDEAQLGIMIGDRNYWDKGYGADAVIALVNYIFLRTSLKRIHLKTLDWNYRAQQCFEKCGFSPCGHISQNGYSFIIMEMYRQCWEKSIGNQDEYSSSRMG